MSAETKEFETHAVLSTLTGMLLGEIGCVYEVLNWMTGEDLFTHQLPRCAREAAPVILAMHPHLGTAVDEAEQITPENFREWRQRWEDRYGPMIAVPRLSADDHERIDPLSEIAEKMRPDQTIVINTPVKRRTP